MLVSCTDDKGIAPAGEGEVFTTSLQIGVSDMTMTAVSRAQSPMSPDLEKYVRSIALFEFDNEGLHEKRATTYHFIDFVKGTVDGVYGVAGMDSTEFGVVEATLNGIAVEYRSNGTLCLVANVTEEQVDEFYEEYREPGASYGRITFDRFKTWALPFDYLTPPSSAYEETVTGHVKTMYMFGYYQGTIEPAGIGNVRIDLGRLAVRFDITIINETGSALDKRLSYKFEKVCRNSYFFPMKSELPPTDSIGKSLTVVCAGNTPVDGDPEFKLVPRTFPDKTMHTRYFYVGAHSASTYEDATKLLISYSRSADYDPSDNNADTYEIPLCNVHPSEAEFVKNGYSLSRNTRYHFIIHLKDKNARSTDAWQTRSVEYGKNHGEITVYLR